MAERWPWRLDRTRPLLYETALRGDYPGLQCKQPLQLPDEEYAPRGKAFLDLVGPPAVPRTPFFSDKPDSSDSNWIVLKLMLLTNFSLGQLVKSMVLRLGNPSTRKTVSLEQ